MTEVLNTDRTTVVHAVGNIVLAASRRREMLLVHREMLEAGYEGRGVLPRQIRVLPRLQNAVTSSEERTSAATDKSRAAGSRAETRGHC